jgi:hypothetical protein
MRVGVGLGLSAGDQKKDSTARRSRAKQDGAGELTGTKCLCGKAEMLNAEKGTTRRQDFDCRPKAESRNLKAET